jgi:Fe-S-cluster containining protein
LIMTVMPPATSTAGRPYLDALVALFADMDDAYRRAAIHYGFHCEGCEDNCCRTRFHHHTCLEVMYLREGLSRLSSEDRSAVERNAGDYLADAAQRPAKGRGPMCPLNHEQRCILYGHRPMICRLHGIPHELHRPGSPPAVGPGCEAFHRHCGHLPYRSFDRTPFYTRMAELERRLRQAIGSSDRVHLTVADIILLP